MEIDRATTERALQRVGQQIDELVKIAGIEEAAARAVEPLHWPNVDDPSDLYFAKNRDQNRQDLRDAYFGVADISLRKRLIAKEREYDGLRRALRDAEVLEYAKALGVAERAAESPSWGLWTAGAVVGVTAGAYRYELMGALVGLAVGLLWAKWASSEKKSRCIEKAKSIQRELKDAQDLAIEVRSQLNTFCESEELTGEPDEAFGAQSEARNYYLSERGARDGGK